MGLKDKLVHITEGIRSRLFVSRGDKVERVQFAKYSHSESEHELNVLHNGNSFTGKCTDTYLSTPADDWGNFGHIDEFSQPGEAGPKQDKISEWQAGWNVTNAIQVRTLEDSRLVKVVLNASDERCDRE